jgi:hypothetical protein
MTSRNRGDSRNRAPPWSKRRPSPHTAHVKRNERWWLVTRAERRASIPRATRGVRTAASRAEGNTADGCGRFSASPPKASDSCLSPGIRRLRNTRGRDARGATGGAVPVGRRRRRARFGDAKQCSDRAGHQVRAPQAIEVDRYRSRGFGSRSTCRVEKRARSLARAPGRADLSPPPVPSRRLSSRTTPSRDARADSRASPRPRSGPPRAPRTRAGLVAAPSTRLVLPSRGSR